MTSKSQTELFVGKWQIMKFGALFLLKIKIERKWKLNSFLFFKEKITLKLLKISRSSEPRVRP